MTAPPPRYRYRLRKGSWSRPPQATSDSTPSPWGRASKAVSLPSRPKWWAVGKRILALAFVLVVTPPAAVLAWRFIETEPTTPRLIAGGRGPATSDRDDYDGRTLDGRSAVIIDGDTVAFGSERVRILNTDAPESHQPNCERELVAGLRAKERLAQLIRSGVVVIEREGQDRYRRTLAWLSVGGRDVGAVLIEERLALPWQDGAAAKQTRTRHWCG